RALASHTLFFGNAGWTHSSHASPGITNRSAPCLGLARAVRSYRRSKGGTDYPYRHRFAPCTRRSTAWTARCQNVDYDLHLWRLHELGRVNERVAEFRGSPDYRSIVTALPR